MPSGLPSVMPYPNGSRTSFASRPSKPPTMGTRRSLPRSTNITGKTAAKTRRPGPLGTPPVTPTGRPEQPMAFDPQSPLTPPTPHPASVRVSVSGCGEGVKVGQGAVGVSRGGIGVSQGCVGANQNRRGAWVEARWSIGGFWGIGGLLDDVWGSRGQVVTASLQAEESPTPTDPWGSAHPPSSTPPTSMTPQYPWIPTPKTTTTSQTPPTIKKPYARTESRTACGSTCWRKCRRNDGRRARASYVVMGCAMWTIDGEDYCGPYPDVFSTPATLLCTTVLAPDKPPAHLPSHSSTNLLLCTTLPFTNKPVPTLVDSGATNNFVDKSLAALAPQPLCHLPAPIPLKLFDRDSTPAGDITHCLEMTMTFTDRQQQELQLLVTKLHPSTPLS
ncbi:hypothetical protein E4T56_gene20323 [Termitomyces sp. T112]|nr:hypothetical protein E4T56_gene20323 [Termitomyces sp. T112]